LKHLLRWFAEMDVVRLPVLGLLRRKDPGRSWNIQLIPPEAPDFVSPLACQYQEANNAPKGLPNLTAGAQHLPELLVAEHSMP
jgi:hypothetical protein